MVFEAAPDPRLPRAGAAAGANPGPGPGPGHGAYPGASQDARAATPPQSLTQKLLARAAGRATATAGDSLDCRVDLALLDDAAGAWPFESWLRSLGGLARERIVLTLAADSPLGEGLPPLAGVYRGLGIGPLVLAQAGWLRPGALVVGGDAHAAVGGAFGALMLGLDANAMLGALVHGELHLAVPPTLFMRWIGRLGDGVGAHDMVLQMHARLGPRVAAGAVLEHGGEAVAALADGERMTLAAMSAGLGAVAGLLAPDRHTLAWLRGAGVEIDEHALADWRSDEDAPGLRHVMDASQLTPQVGIEETDAGAAAAPPWQARALDDLEPTRIDLACLGGAEGAKFDDLHAAARVLAGHRVAAGVQLLVAPATRLDRELAAREGVLRRLVEAGATLLSEPRLRGGPVADSTVIASCARPFGAQAAPRRGGAALLRASPYTVAASALRGRVSDAREVLA